MIVVCGRSAETIRPRVTRCSIFSYQVIEARVKQFLCVSVSALPTGTNTNFLDRLYKNQATMDTYMYIQWPAC